MTATDAIARLPATELVKLYRTRKLSPVEATRAIVDRIKRLDQYVNAFALLDEEAALASAQASEARWHSGAPLGPADGVPVAIKDLLLTKGWPTLRGSRSVDPNQAWNEDAPAVARLREGGAVLLGKTTTSEFGWKGLADSLLTGVTRNPWNLTRTAGGSSGGSAAAAALGFAPLHVATDGGGSTRLPSAFSGTFGFKQTFGRVPCYPAAHTSTLFNVTALTHNVADTALMLNVMARPDPRDWHALPADGRDWNEGLDDGVKGLRIAFSPALGYAQAQVDPQVAALIADAVKVFAERGAIVDQVDPGIEDPFPIFRTMWFGAAARLLAGIAPERRKLTDPGLQAVAEQGRAIDAVTYLITLEAREALGRHFNLFHRNWDLLICPTTAVPALPAEYSQEELAKRPVPSPFTYPFNLTQQPAASIPVGLTKEGLPVGMQIIAAKFEDAKVLRAARAFEEARPLPWPKDPS